VREYSILNEVHGILPQFPEEGKKLDFSEMVLVLKGTVYEFHPNLQKIRNNLQYLKNNVYFL
jgi:hypothetical protein